MGADGTPAPQTEATTPLSRAQAVGVAASDGWHLLRAAYRVPVESRSPRVWFRQQLAPLLPATCGCGLVREALETGVGGIRRVERYSVGMAVHRRGDDQGTAGRGKKTGPNPTDRAKSGTKRSLLTDGAGVPLGVAVSGANTHDKRLVEETLQSVPVKRPKPTRRKRQNLCADKGYDYPDVRQLLRDWGYTAHIKSRGEEESERKQIPGYRARRWVVERTHSWFNRFRRLLIRWEKKAENYVAFVHFACAWVTFRAAGILG